MPPGGDKSAFRSREKEEGKNMTGNNIIQKVIAPLSAHCLHSLEFLFMHLCILNVLCVTLG
jgi:hypothetical protein